MKSKAALLWFVVSLGLVAALAMQWKTSKTQQHKIESLQLQVEKTPNAGNANVRVEELEQELERLSSELQAAQTELDQHKRGANISSAAAAPSQLTSPTPEPNQGAENGGGALGKMLSNMMKDPEMRKAMAQQQRMSLDMVYGSLFKELNLSKEEQEKFKDLLIDQQMENMSQAGAIFGDGEGDRSAAMKEMAEKGKENQEAIKALLGEEKYAQYQDYTQTALERMMLDQFGKQAEINPEQNQQLLAVILEEKKNVQINWSGQPADPVGDMEKFLDPSGEGMARMVAQQEEVNKRVIERAGQILTPDQLQKFTPLLNNQLEMQKAGLKMAQQMRRNNKDAAPPAPPQPIRER